MVDPKVNTVVTNIEDYKKFVTSRFGHVGTVGETKVNDTDAKINDTEANMLSLKTTLLPLATDVIPWT